MITVANANIETPIELTPGNPVVLVEENPSEFYKAVSSLINAFSDENSEFTFWKGDEQISPSKHGEILTNTFGFDFADKKKSIFYINVCKASFSKVLFRRILI